MKTTHEKTKAPDPLFDNATAVPVTPTRHEPTGRTIAFVQGDHLFSATRAYVATDHDAGVAATAAATAGKKE